VFRTGLWTLRQPRYAAMAALLLVVALICVVAGTWQISRFEQTVRENKALDANAHAAAVPLTIALIPLVGHGRTPGRDVISFRTVTVSGTYIAGPQQFLRNETLSGINGYYAVNPLRTAAGVLLVVRGFVAAADSGAPPTTVTAPPSGPVQVTGRLASASTTNDAATALGGGQLESINPAEQSARLGAPVYAAYVTLTTNQPGTAGVTVLPDPDLSNPAGGAYEWQHFAYIIQWYLFALLALAAPFIIGRSEVREAQKRYLGIDPGQVELGLEAGDEQDQPLQLDGARSAGGAVALRSNGTVGRREPTTEEWQRAARLADRYGRSLGIGHDAPKRETPPSGRRPRPSPAAASATVESDDFYIVKPDSSTRPHRSLDDYQGSYNDYLWQLGLADGEAPPVALPSAEDVGDKPSGD
jgi:cytochrome oxidase assembly protein ShyY1